MSLAIIQLTYEVRMHVTSVPSDYTYLAEYANVALDPQG